jgi:hypothetical protein
VQRHDLLRLILFAANKSYLAIEAGTDKAQPRVQKLQGAGVDHNTINNGIEGLRKNTVVFEALMNKTVNLAEGDLLLTCRTSEG